MLTHPLTGLDALGQILGITHGGIADLIRQEMTVTAVMLDGRKAVAGHGEAGHQALVMILSDKRIVARRIDERLCRERALAGGTVQL